MEQGFRKRWWYVNWDKERAKDELYQLNKFAAMIETLKWQTTDVAQDTLYKQHLTQRRCVKLKA